MRKRTALVMLACLCFSAVAAAPAEAQTTAENVGFIPSNIWYSKEPFFAGETVRVYTVLYNSSGEDIVGTIVFLDKDKEIGRTDFSLARGRVQDVWIDWAAEAGGHAITAVIRDAKAKLPGGGEVAVTLANAKTSIREANVDTDIDKDGIGDRDDPDRDGDGLKNTEEVKLGTDPAKKDTDGDGVEDGKDAAPVVAAEKQLKESVLGEAREKVPAAAAETAKQAFGVVEAFRKGQAVKEEGRIEAVRQKIRKETTVPRSSEAGAPRAKRWVDWALLGIHYVLLIILKFQIAFYLAVVFGLFYAARFLRRLFAGDRFA